MKRVPADIPRNRSRRSFTMISVPPVVAPCIRTSSKPIAIRHPPATQASSGSVVSGPNGRSRFIITDESTTETIVEVRKRIPNLYMPRPIIGMFRISTTVPILKSGKNFAIIMAIPVNPPGTMPLGSRKRLMATAYITEPMHIRRYFKIKLLIFAFIKITFPFISFEILPPPFWRQNLKALRMNLLFQIRVQWTLIWQKAFHTLFSFVNYL